MLRIDKMQPPQLNALRNETLAKMQTLVDMPGKPDQLTKRQNRDFNKYHARLRRIDRALGI